MVGTAKSQKGLLRYRLANGAYVTANPAYVGNLYWQGAHYRHLRVINPRGVNTYSRVTLTHRRTHQKKGAVLRVTRITHRGVTTRYQLTNGQWVTGNKQWVSLLK